jgi:hypothetical protein
MVETSVMHGPIPQDVRESFRSALSLPSEKLQQIGQWIKGHPDFIGNRELDPSDLERASADLGMAESEFAGALSLVATLLFFSERPGQLTANDLRNLGLGDQEEKVRLLLTAIDIPAGDLEYSRQKALLLRSAIPTLDDVDALCDLRAIFRRVPSASASSTHLSSVKILLGFQPVAIVSLQLNDAAGQDSAYVFQVSEQGLRHLVKTLQEALAQVEIVKDVQKTLVVPKDTI